MGVEVLDDSLKEGWDVTISKVVAVNGRILQINPYTVRDYDFERKHARIRNTFPILCAMNAENVTFQDLIVDGNRAQNTYLDGCRGGAIYCYNVRNVTVKNCVARNYNGDGISFQISDNVHVVNSESYGHTGYGLASINTAAEAIRFVKQFHSPSFKIILDVKAMSSEAKPIPQIIQESWPHFAYFHANDKNFKGPGFGEIDFKPIAAALKGVGYGGYVSVEVFNFDEGPEAIATRSLEYLKSVFADR